ncbi:hypothetical protein [Nocardia beijingensis]|uniref:Uncharacterized protein n=1 Tax=Nocardia beijingensis TaxID=95162 RepID=A0ABW7WP43_9NOCA
MTVRQADPIQFGSSTAQFAVAPVAAVSPPLVYNHCVHAHRYGRQLAV